MIEKTILVSNLDIFVYDLKNELDSKNMDYVSIKKQMKYENMKYKTNKGFAK